MHTLYLEKQFLLCLSPFWIGFGPEKAAFLYHVHIWLLWSVTVISESVPEPMQWLHDRILPIFTALLPVLPKYYRHLVLIFKVFVTLHLGALCWNWYTTCRHSFCISSHVTERLAVNLVAKYSSSCFLLVKLTFPAFCYHCPNFLRSVAANKII